MRKATLWCFTILILASVMTACTENRLKFEIAKLNANCPRNIQDLLSIDAVTLEDDTVMFKMSTSEKEMQEITEQADFPKFITRSFLIGMKTTDKRLIKLMVDANIAIKTVIVSKSSKKKLVGILTAEDIKDIMNQEEQMGDAVLRLITEETSKLPPEDLGGGLWQTGIQFDDYYLIYKYEIDEQQLDMNDIIKDLSKLKASYMGMIRTNPEVFGGEGIIKILVDSDRGLKFLYEGKTSKETVEVTISNFELKMQMN